MQQQNMAAKNTLFTFMLTSLTVLTRVQTDQLSYINTQNPEFSTSEDLILKPAPPPTTAAPFKNLTFNQQQAPNVRLFAHSHSPLHSTKYPQIFERPSFSSPPVSPSARALRPRPSSVGFIYKQASSVPHAAGRVQAST